MYLLKRVRSTILYVYQSPSLAEYPAGTDWEPTVAPFASNMLELQFHLVLKPGSHFHWSSIMIIHKHDGYVITTCYQGSSVRQISCCTIKWCTTPSLSSTCTPRSAPRSELLIYSSWNSRRCSELSLQVMFLSFSTAAERAAVGCAVVFGGDRLRAWFFFFSTGLLVSNGAVDFELLQILVSAFFFFLVSNGTSLSEATDFSITSAFSVDGAGAFWSCAELERPTLALVLPHHKP